MASPGSPGGSVLCHKTHVLSCRPAVKRSTGVRTNPRLLCITAEGSVEGEAAGEAQEMMHQRNRGEKAEQ